MFYQAQRPELHRIFNLHQFYPIRDEGLEGDKDTPLGVVAKSSRFDFIL